MTKTPKLSTIEIYPASLEALCQEHGITRSLSQKERDAIDESDFAGPHDSFPVDSQEHLDAAAHLIGHAENPDAVKAKAIEIAKRKGLKLPEAWLQGEQKETQERTVPETSVDRSLPDGMLALDGYTPHMSFPIVRSDPKDWTVYGRATVEEPDRHGTIFSYEGAKGAFARWKGNIREQHDIKKAVGKRVDYEFNDAEKGVYLLARVSRGAPDTWEKVMDSTLSDFSVNVVPAEQYGTNPRMWPKKEFNGKMYPYLPEYDYAEISLVDSGSAPGAQFMPIVRADGSPTEVLTAIEDEPPVEEAQPETLERAGARVSSETHDKMHASIKHTLHAVSSQMQNCGCENCKAALKLIDPDEDGDIDMGGYDDPDHDWQSLYNSNQPTDDATERTITGLIERALMPVYARLQGIAGTLARSSLPTKPVPSPTVESLETLVTGAITRAVEAASLAQASSLTEVRADLSAVKEQVVAIANTPLPGAPIMNAGALPRPIEKRLATDSPYDAPRRSGSSVYDAVAALSNGGQLDTVERQVDAMAAALAAQRRG